MSKRERFAVVLVVFFGLALAAVVAIPLLDDDSSSCQREVHLYDSEDDLPGPGRESYNQYDYESMSLDAQRIIDRALDDGDYFFTDGSKEAPEFSFTDEVGEYEIAYRNETYYLWVLGCLET